MRKLAVATVLLFGLMGCSSASSTGTSTTPAVQPTVQHSSAQTSGVGQTVTLKGVEPGEAIAVTLIKVVPNGKTTDTIANPKTLPRQYGIQLNIKNIGSVPYSDSPYNVTVLFDSQNQQYTESSAEAITAGPSFANTVNLQPGESAKGFIVMEPPKHVTITKMELTNDDGQPGEWNL